MENLDPLYGPKFSVIVFINKGLNQALVHLVTEVTPHYGYTCKSGISDLEIGQKVIFSSYSHGTSKEFLIMVSWKIENTRFHLMKFRHKGVD